MSKPLLSLTFCNAVKDFTATVVEDPAPIIYISCFPIPTRPPPPQHFTSTSKASCLSPGFYFSHQSIQPSSHSFNFWP
ncbi:hypothetical protein GQ44DRAFT_701417 [Phaeosphaeriaceae sp. PMI808]|nr:hypothetical protein GQ44DRAFT_701417 [Phaeosphaeriaceae sp. PMI808]